MQICMSIYNISDIVLHNFHNYLGTEEIIFLLTVFREKIQRLREAVAGLSVSIPHATE